MNPPSYLELLEAPTQSVVSIEDARDELGFSESDGEDLRIESALEAAVTFFETHTGRALAERRYLESFAYFPVDDCGLHLGRGPLLEVQGVAYYEPTGILVEGWTDYVAYKRLPPVLDPKSGKAWPVTERRRDAVQVTYRAGYVSAERIEHGILRCVLLIARYILDPDEHIDLTRGRDTRLPGYLLDLAAPYVIREYV